MKIADSIAFIEHKHILNIGLKNGSDREFSIALNFSTFLYCRLICLVDTISKMTNETEQIKILNELTTDILKTSDERINIDWVATNIDSKVQMELITEVMFAIQTILESDCFVIPELNVQKKRESTKSKEAQESQKKKDEIKRLTDLLAKSSDKFLMGDINLVMTKTNNSFSEIMKMPILIFKDLVREIIINEFKTDDDYNLAYLKYLAHRANVELNSGNNSDKKKPYAKTKGVNREALKAFFR